MKVKKIRAIVVLIMALSLLAAAIYGMFVGNFELLDKFIQILTIVASNYVFRCIIG